MRDERTETVCELRHGIQLVVEHIYNVVSIKEVVVFLAEAQTYIQQHRQNPEIDFVTEGWFALSCRRNRRNVGMCHLFHDGEDKKLYPKLELWIEAIMVGHCGATSIVEMLEHLQEWRQWDIKTGGACIEVMELLAQPTGDILALQRLLPLLDSHAKNMGSYVPGAVGVPLRQMH